LHGFLLFDGDTAEAGVGAALLWADKLGLERVSLLVDPPAAGHVARRAGFFATGPRLEVLTVDGTALTPAVPGPAREVPVLSTAEWSLAGLINDSGARAVDDHGRVVAEFAGLEVARVLVDDNGAWLEVGVGQADRELNQLVHRDLDPDAMLRRAIGAVVAHRRAGAPPHPLNRLARERWLRSIVLDSPEILGLTTAEPVAPLRPRDTLLGTRPVAVSATDSSGRPVVVVCSVGVEVDLAAEAADYRERIDPSARLLVAVPERDRYPVIDRLVSRLPSAELVSMATPWDAAAAE
jgi:hypothetical protein